MKLFRTTGGIFVEEDEQHFLIANHGWDALLPGRIFRSFSPPTWNVRNRSAASTRERSLRRSGRQEVWAAGVTYFRSRGARMEEAKDAGGGDFYDRVYSAERPELFFKSTASRTVGPGGKVRIRADAHWSVPEPELTLAISPGGRITGYTIGNDMSSRDIEGENPLYLPQAKVYNGSCALGPGILVSQGPLPHSTEIVIEILRHGRIEFSGSVALTELKRDPKTSGRVSAARQFTFPSECS